MRSYYSNPTFQVYCNIICVEIYYFTRDYTRPDLPSGGEGEVTGSSNVPDLSAALAGILVYTINVCTLHTMDVQVTLISVC